MARYSVDTVATSRGFRRLDDVWFTPTSQDNTNTWLPSSGSPFDASAPVPDGNDGAPLAPGAAIGSGAADAGPAITEIFNGQSSALANFTASSALGGSAANSPSNPFDATAAEVREAVDATNLAVTGAGITVGVLSDSFNDLGGATQDEANGALPPAADIDVIKDLGSGGTDEGRAMMQIVHDIAPGANLDFYTADVSEQDFANGILSLAAAGCKVICDDVTYFDEPFFQTGVVANAIQTVEQEGVIFVTAAGNNAESGYQAAWNEITTTTFDGTVLHDAQNFGGGSAVETVTIGGSANADTVPFVFEWNQPYGSVTSDLEVLVFSGGKLLGAVTNSSSGEPTNPFIAFGLSSGFTYQMAIVNLSGPNPGLIGEMSEGDGLPVSINVADAGTVQGHHMSTDAITVGAVDAGNTPAFGGTLQSESYSSSGLDTQLWFNFNGSTVANGPLDLSPVALSGVDDISTSVSGGLSDFFGTSAATPSVAAVVALMLQENPNLTFAQVEQILDQTATSFGNSEVAGAGLVNAAAAVAAAGAIGDDVVSWAAAVSGSFAIAANWTPETVPGSSNNVEIVSSGSYIVTSSASETVNSLIIALGATLDVTGGTFTITDSNQTTVISGTVLAASGATIVLEGSASNSNALQAIGGVIDIAGTLGGSGAVDIGQNGTVDLLNGSIAGNVTFTGPNADLVLHDAGIGGQIIGAVATDSIDATFAGFAAGEHAVWQQTGSAGGMLSLYENGTDLVSFNLAGQYNSLDFAVSDGGGGTIVTVQNMPIYGQNPGNTDEWILSDGHWVESAAPGSHPSGYNVVGIGDWTGGGTDGILWFDPATGDTDEWQLADTQWSASVDLGTHPGSYQISGVGDFFDNGIDDVLWTSSNSNGSVATDIWQLASNGQWTASVSPGSHPAGYALVGTGDWTGDGTDGVLWYDASTGDTDEWQLVSGQWSASVDLGSQPGSYQISGIGDFFDSGRDDVLWTSVNGDGTISTDIWELGTNGQRIASANPGTHPAGYQVVAVGDFTGTGTSDILWQDPTTGDVDEWLINNGQWAGSIDLGTHPGNFQIAGVGDFNGQGNAGIFWHATT